MAATSTIDLSRLPAPTVVEQLSYEGVLATLVADLQASFPAFDATVDADPAVKLLQVVAYRELLLRQQFNDRARQVMLAFAAGSNLDQLAALVGVERLLLTPPNTQTGAPAVFEGDEELRRRVVLAPESFAAAGPASAYVYHALSADPRVRDASAISPAAGDVLVSVLARAGNGTAPPDLLAAVRAVVTADDIRPLGDRVTVASATIVAFTVDAALTTSVGPDSALVLSTARARLDAYLEENRLLGRDITTSGLIAALTAPGVRRVVLAGPIADVVCDPTQAAWCSGITITHAGYAD